MDNFQCYMRQYGMLLTVYYVDKHTTYRSPAEPTVEDQLVGVQPESQFGRALRELGVELIVAHSPQVKCRVEQLFPTFHDRLIKELRLAGIATLADANRFLAHYLPEFFMFWWNNGSTGKFGSRTTDWRSTFTRSRRDLCKWRRLKPLSRAHRPVTPKPNHPWRKRWRPEQGEHVAVPGPLTQTFLPSKKEDISIVALHALASNLRFLVCLE
jgi:hypothetical protein